ncbi:MAG: 50S ribosomal protein L3 [Candidatus Aenigmatarchaeota archaeon]
MVKESKPRSGSLAFYPRKRARRIYPRIKTYPESEKAKILAFAGYKVGMAQAIVVDTRKESPTFGQEISVPVTILDCPPLKVVGIRAYQQTKKGLKVFTEAWTKDLPKDLERKVKVKPKEENLKKIEENIDKVSKIRLIVCTQPRISGVKKKKPEVFEIEVGGKDVKEKFEFSKSLFGKEISVKDFVREGELVDVIAVTKGKGFAGPVKRFGVKIQVRHAKKKRRHVGTLGSQVPRRVLYTVPQAGQLGFQTRTEFNKRVLKVGENGKEITPKGGFVRYGILGSHYILLQGSVPGPRKRLIMLRHAIRPGRVRFLPVEIKEIVVKSG